MIKFDDNEEVDNCEEEQAALPFFCDKLDNARYSDILESLINELDAEKILRLDYEADYSGYVDIDVLLKNGKIFSYYYSYGSCSGCDDWEARGLSDDKIKKIMKKEATFFKDMKEYDKWRSNVNEEELKKENHLRAVFGEK